MIYGYESASKNKGGIKSICLLDSSELLSCEYDTENKIFNSITLAEGAEFCNICYFEDSAYYSETFTVSKLCAKVKHELSFAICDTDPKTKEFVDRILSLAAKRLIAIVTDNNSVSYLVGFSSSFLSERALKLSSAISDTAYEPKSRPMTLITLSSYDTSRAERINSNL